LTSPGPDELAEWLSRTALRDQVAYEALYRATAAKLFGFVLRILQRRDLAEDCLQDAFVSIWHRAGDYRADRAQPFTWMAAIARNRALDMLRAASSYREIAVGDEIDAWESERASVVEEAVAGDDARALQRCLEQLPATHRQAIAWSYFRGLAHAELAKNLAQPLGTVKTWIRKGLMQLRQCLERP
jgi:RNA polymerase sigma-70 factor (ECF subfamily)